MVQNAGLFSTWNSEFKSFDRFVRHRKTTAGQEERQKNEGRESGQAQPERTAAPFVYNRTIGASLKTWDDVWQALDCHARLTNLASAL